MQNYTDFPYDGVADGNLWTPFADKPDGGIYNQYAATFCSSIFPASSLPHQLSVTPNALTTITTTTPVVVDYSPRHSLDFTPFQDLIDRRNWCLSGLRLTEKQSESLRRENVDLQSANSKLNWHLSLLQQQAASTSSNYGTTASFPSVDSVADCLGRMKMGEKGTTAGERRAARVHPVKKPELDRVKLPKSISVLSNGYLKKAKSGDGIDGRVRAADRVKPAAHKQKVYIRGVKKEEGPVELEVYKQGMTKTELCNKWQQTGACPYGHHCRFAHGIEELRPVLRHPLYKTEICRLVLAGDTCPYGHRCHFRHALTHHDKLPL